MLATAACLSPSFSPTSQCAVIHETGQGSLLKPRNSRGAKFMTKEKGICCVCLAAMVALSGTIWAADGTTGISDQTTGGASEETQNKEQLAEVIVTAQKREERLQDVPVAVSVVSADSMLQNSQLVMQDYYASVPGLQINDQGVGGRMYISMRGISTGTTNPTVGITIDDVPILQTVTGDINNAVYVPQLDPADIQSIEFLKGPQGTLYGATSIGGVMRYVTAVPDLTSTFGRVQLDGSGVTGGGTGYGARGSVNLPVIDDTLAIRASAFARHDPGYIDDPTHGESDVNSTDAYGGHLAALWQPTQALSLRLGALIQRQEGNDGTFDSNYLGQPINWVFPNSGPAIVGPSGCLCQSRLPGAANYSQENQIYSAALKYNSQFFDVTSITGYSEFNQIEKWDATLLNGTGLLAEQLYGVPGSLQHYPISSNKFSEEVRLESPAGSRFEWRLGGFYTHEGIPVNNADVYANNLQTGETVGVLFHFYATSTYREDAGFADFTYHFTDRFNVQVGAREGYNNQHLHEDVSGPAVGPPFTTDVFTHSNSFTYLVTPQLKLSDSVMTYIRVSSGYQPGGPNTPGGPGEILPLSYRPSTTVNYEVGLKSELLDRRLVINTDIFYIDWKNVQLQGFTAPPFEVPYIFNGGTARSEGLEFDAAFKPIETLTLSAAAAYTDAILTNTPGNGFPGVSGEPLPFSSKYSGSLSADYNFRVSGPVNGFAGATVAYVGARYDQEFSAGFLPSEEPYIPGYTYGNVRAGIVTNGYTVTAYVKNVTNERGILVINPFNGGSYAHTGIWQTTIITPRTIGLSVSKQF
jgi:iron complex outermembrane recepter protein